MLGGMQRLTYFAAHASRLVEDTSLRSVTGTD